MSNETRQAERSPITTQQISDLHAALVERIGHGIDPALVRQAAEDAGFEWLHKVDEPRSLLAVVRDRQGRRYFRWAYSSHTFSPWRDIGAVHCDTDDNFRWEDLTGDRTPIEVVSPGIPEVP